MTTEQWLKMLRRQLSDVDMTALRRTDQQLLAMAEDERFELAVRQVKDFDKVTIGLDKADTVTYGIQGANDSQLAILLYGTAYYVLSATYRERIDRGELGISWKSGLEEESSIQAEKAYRGMLDELAVAQEELVTIYQRRTANQRKQ